MNKVRRPTSSFIEPHFILHHRVLYTVCMVLELRREGPTFNSGALPRAQETEADHLAQIHKDHSPDPPPASRLRQTIGEAVGNLSP